MCLLTVDNIVVRLVYYCTVFSTWNRQSICRDIFVCNFRWGATSIPRTPL